MALTPLEIHNKEFTSRMRGYDQDEVNEFLDQIIRDYEIIIREKKELEDELSMANKKLTNYEEMQESLNKSILVAQDAADRLKENTDREIEVIKREAESYAENVRKEADDYVNKVHQEAEEYSENIHKEADDNADELLQEAVLKARKIEDETEALRKQSRVFRQRLQLLIESQLELLTKEDWDNLLVGKPIEYPDTETIEEVEKKLEEKEEEQEEVEENETAEITEEAESIEETTDSEVEEDSGENEEETSTDDDVAFETNEQYNSEGQEEYEEGTMPAVELPEAAQNK